MNTAESTNVLRGSDESARRLAVYGSLAPGSPNHHQLADLSGRWIEGSVRGQLRHEGWGAQLGFPGLVLDPDGPRVDVQLFDSPDLLDHWARLDAFEGSGYRRVTTAVSTAEGQMEASIYVLVLPEPAVSRRPPATS